MTLFNQIGESGYSDIITKRLTTPGGSNAPSVAPEIFPVIALEQDRPEWGFLKGELLFSRAIPSAAAGAGAHSTIVLAPPSQQSGSRTLVVVSHICTDVLCRIGLSGSSGTTVGVGPGRSRDSRFEAASQSNIIIGNILTASLPERVAFAFPGVPLTVPFVVRPGTFLMIAAAADNTPINGSIAWTERGAQPGELA